MTRNSRSTACADGITEGGYYYASNDFFTSEHGGTHIDAPLHFAQGHLAVDAFFKYGKGRHAARLNMSDCFTYALAMDRGYQLLFKGNDFVETDIVPAWRP